ncbi:hypothetical protein [Frigoribacterium sp. UYMn621]|uniref:hypothetical protein n=1 Tax=Frigoribacterium sp. UYMn621 TaxID=3156343 RepID=UPI003392DD2F
MTTAETADRDRDRGRGRTSVSARALGRVASAVSASALGVDAATVGVDLSDERGELVLTVRSAIRSVSLDRVTTDPGVVARTGGSILERASRAQGQIRSRVNDLTGYRVARVVVRLQSADIRQEDRVR